MKVFILKGPVLLLYLFTLNTMAENVQSISSEVFTVECHKANLSSEIRHEKMAESCMVQRIEKSRKKTLFSDKASDKACELPFQEELKRLKRSGYLCE